MCEETLRPGVPNTQMGPSMCTRLQETEKSWMSESSLELSSADNRIGEAWLPIGWGVGNNIGHGGPCLLKGLQTMCMLAWKGSVVY